MRRWSRDEIAKQVAQDIPEGAYVNLGIGMPTLVADHLPPDREIILHSENGLLGTGPRPPAGEEDMDILNAGKQPVTVLPGAAFTHHADSFTMMRGGHIDICVLGAFQVSDRGDLANWHSGGSDSIPAVGGAMDLAVGAKCVFVTMDLLTKQGASKLVERCSYPLTGVACVSRVYTDVAVFDLGPNGARVRSMIEGHSIETLRALTGVPLAS